MTICTIPIFSRGLYRHALKDSIRAMSYIFGAFLTLGHLDNLMCKPRSLASRTLGTLVVSRYDMIIHYMEWTKDMAKNLILDNSYGHYDIKIKKSIIYIYIYLYSWQDNIYFRIGLRPHKWIFIIFTGKWTGPKQTATAGIKWNSIFITAYIYRINIFVGSSAMANSLLRTPSRAATMSTDVLVMKNKCKHISLWRTLNILHIYV